MRSQYVLEGFRNSCCGLDLWCPSDTHDHDELARWIHTGTESLLPFREEPLSQAMRLHPVLPSKSIPLSCPPGCKRTRKG